MTRNFLFRNNYWLFIHRVHVLTKENFNYLKTFSSKLKIVLGFVFDEIFLDNNAVFKGLNH